MRFASAIRAGGICLMLGAHASGFAYGDNFPFLDTTQPIADTALPMEVF